MRRTTAAVIASVGLLLTACGSDTPTAGQDTTSATSSAASGSGETPAETSVEASGAEDAPVDYSALVVADDAFPAPFEVQPVDEAAIAGFLETLQGGGGVEITPAECADTTGFVDADDLGLAVAVDPATGASLAEVVGPSSGELGELTDRLAGCSEVTVSVAGPDGQAATGTGTITVADAPEVEADETLAVSTVSTIEVPGGVTAQSATLAYLARVGDVLVSATASALDGEVTPELEAALAQVFEAGIAAVAAA